MCVCVINRKKLDKKGSLIQKEDKIDEKETIYCDDIDTKKIIAIVLSYF